MNTNYNVTSPNFGMALHMNERRIERALGGNAGYNARAARAELEKLATDCDIFVYPVNEYIKWTNACRIECAVADKAKNAFQAFFKPRTILHTYVYGMRPGYSIKDELIKSVEAAKQYHFKNK